MIEDTIDAATARRFYDRLGARHDVMAVYETRARRRAVSLLGARAGDRVLDAGAGTGVDAAELCHRVSPGGAVVAADVSPVMLGLVRARSGAEPVRADVRRLPFADATFDGVLCAYLLDLIPAAELDGVLTELRRVTRPQGRMIAVSLTEGTTPGGRALMAAWSSLHRVRPAWLGGCRPVRLVLPLTASGWAVERREVVRQIGFPSEVVAAVRPDVDSAAPRSS